jgi:sugar lactone lactonase YvrE
LDTAGNLFISDYGNARIRRVDTNGIITTIVGNGTNGYAGDGGAATNASLYGPFGLALDSVGNLYICEQVNGCVRKVDTTGIINTVASGGFNEPDGVAVDAAGNIYIADSLNNFIKKVDTNGVITYVTRSNYPIGVAVDTAGNLYIGDTYSGTVREVHFGGFPTLSLTAVSTNDAGNYSVIITSNSGSVTSAVAVLTVVIAPTIVTQPASQTIPAGSNVTFSVVASGLPLPSYQWLFNGTVVDGQTNSILSLSSVTTNQAGAYCVLVSSPYGSVTSHVAVLTVGWLPTITAQPTNQSLLAGSRALLTVDVSGVGPLTFQWQLNGTNLPNNLISTIAGNGTNGYAGDGGLAITGKVNTPYGVTADRAGNVYIADTGNNRIRKVDTNGVLTAVTTGYSPKGVVADAAGNLYFIDSSFGLRKVDTNGAVTTLTNGMANPSGLAIDSNGNLLVADTGHNRILKVDTNGVMTRVAGTGTLGFSGDGGLATNANLNQPQGVAVDGAGNLYIADRYNHRIRKVDVNGVITTIAGTNTLSAFHEGAMATNVYLGPAGVTVDDYGDVFIADPYYNRIFRVDPYGVITSVAGTNISGYNGDGIAATNAQLYQPVGLSIDSWGRILVADSSNARIRRFGQGPALVIDNLAATNAGDYTLIINSSFGSVTSSVATLTVLGPPFILSSPTNQTAGLGSNAVFAVSAIGVGPLSYQWQINGTNLPSQTGSSLTLTNVQWSDAGNYTVIITNNYGSVTSSVATLTVGWPPAITSQPTDLMVSAGSNVWLSIQVSGDSPFTYQWQLNGTNLPPIITTFAGTNAWGYSGDGGAATNAKLSNPYGVCVDKCGNVYIAENGNNRVRRVDTNGIITTFAGTGTSGHTGNGGQATNANLQSLRALCTDSADNFYISESFYGGDIRKVDTNGVITLFAGLGTAWVDGVPATSAYLCGPFGMTIDQRGNMFLSDAYYNRIRKIATNGIITTVAGSLNGSTVGGFSGDGGPATNAALSTPNGVAVDDSGNVYFSDTGNGRIRKVDANGIINTVVGGGTNLADGILGTNKYLGSPLATCVHGTDLFFGANSRVLKMDNNGIVTTVAGGRAYSPSNNGDYGAATNAYLGGAYGIAFDALGNMLIADGSWRVRKVHFSGDPTLYLPNSGTNNSGVYTVVITSPYGSVTSSNFTLTVISPPSVISVSPNPDGTVTLNLTGMTNFSSRLYVTTNLVPPITWTPIYTNPVGGAWQFTDTNAPNQPAQFYRVSTP